MASDTTFHGDPKTKDARKKKESLHTHIMKDGQPLSGGAQRRLLLLLLSPQVLLFGRLQAHSDHLRARQHLLSRLGLFFCFVFLQDLLEQAGRDAGIESGRPVFGGEGGRQV